MEKLMYHEGKANLNSHHPNITVWGLQKNVLRKFYHGIGLPCFYGAALSRAIQLCGNFLLDIEKQIAENVTIG